MSLHVMALRAKDKEFEKHMAVFKACLDADVELPEATKKYLGDGADYNNAHDAELAALEIDVSGLVEVVSEPGMQDQIIDLLKLPKGVTRLVFRASW